MLAAALGLAPHKDVFWSSSVQLSNPYGPTYIEHAPALEAAVATYSCGPVVPGDAVGLANKTLLAMSHMIDGTLLKPSYPATPLDSYFLQKCII